MNGLKNVRNRRDDTLSRMTWDRFEALMALYYREQGYRVEHVGTAATGSRFDGGVDLKLYREDEYILVQCKHWNAKQVPHNAVHELLGIMVNQAATGAVLVTSGEFSRAAREAAARQGHVQLIDGDTLRAMLGSLLALEAALPDAGTPVSGREHSGREPPDIGSRRRGSRTGASSGARTRAAVSRRANAIWWCVALVCGLVFWLLIRLLLERTAWSAGPEARVIQGTGRSAPTTIRTMEPPTANAAVAVPHASDPEAIRAQAEPNASDAQRKADDAMRVIEDSTPEM